MSKGRVIVPYGRSLMSLAVAQSLHAKGLEVIGCDDVELTVLSFSKHARDHFRHASISYDGEDAFIDSLIEAAERFRPDDGRPYVLMPVFKETRVIAKARDRFPDYLTIAGPSIESIHRVHPKDRLAALTEETGAAAPTTFHTEDTRALRDALRDGPSRLLIKPVDGVGGRGIEFFDEVEEAIEAHRAFVEEKGAAPLIQEAVAGEDYCYTALFKDGAILTAMAYRNLKRFPSKSGAGAMRETVDAAPFHEIATRLMAPTGWTGVAEIDFMWTGERQDTPCLIEVNPRFWAGLYHSIASGVDYPWLLYELFVDGSIAEKPRPKIGEITKTPYLWLAAAAQEIADSDSGFEAVKDAWRERKGEGPLKRLQAAVGALKESHGFEEMSFKLLEALDMGRGAKDEFHDDDPFVGLGALFVLSSLARRGELPEELRF